MGQHVILNKALFGETGTFNDMALRPYEAHLRPQTVDLFQEATLGGTHLTPSNISSIAGGFLQPSAMAQGQAQIENGWATPRFRFILDIQHPTSLGSHPVRKILQGYTSHAGLSGSHVDPNMVLYFNNVLTLRTSTFDTPHGRKENVSVAESNHLLRSKWEPSFDFNGNDHMTTSMRPEDVFHTMNLNQMADENIVDFRTGFAESPLKKSRRKNTNPAHYVSSVLDSYKKSTNNESLGLDYDDWSSRLSEARGMVIEDGLNQDQFFHMLTMQTQSFEEGGCITYGELCNLMPEFDQMAHFATIKQVEKHQQQQGVNGFLNESHRAGQTEHWFGSTLETTWATALSQSVPSLLMDLMMTRVVFKASNRLSAHEVAAAGYPPYDIAIVIGNCDGFVEGIDMRPYIQTFTDRLRQEILLGLSQNSVIDFDIECTVDVIGETRLKMSIDSAPFVEYASPSFADGLFVPVLTNNQNGAREMANSMEILSQNLSVDHKPMPTMDMPMGNMPNSNQTGGLNELI